MKSFSSHSDHDDDDDHHHHDDIITMIKTDSHHHPSSTTTTTRFYSDDEDSTERNHSKQQGVLRENCFDRIPTRHCTNRSMHNSSRSTTSTNHSNNKTEQSQQQQQQQATTKQNHHYDQHQKERQCRIMNNKKRSHRKQRDTPFFMLLLQVGMVITLLFGVTYTILSYNRLFVQHFSDHRYHQTIGSHTKTALLRNQNNHIHNNIAEVHAMDIVPLPLAQLFLVIFVLIFCFMSRFDVIPNRGACACDVILHSNE
jgi:hypothetical protein